MFDIECAWRRLAASFNTGGRNNTGTGCKACVDVCLHAAMQVAKSSAVVGLQYRDQSKRTQSRRDLRPCPFVAPLRSQQQSRSTPLYPNNHAARQKNALTPNITTLI
ncbi:hypothetical protein [Bradyrhizobium sp. 143]|uniref:hypothetical protein n=1 Tax=Bradyrhizobium sp. 143 TaxID=2782619 RepID=UPI001FFBF6E7|nr:hypothetical protein [Bradyrhizobium sp. 143]MCK1709578.1 hypothetical protein [Bradyrhizobium sp. 143]